MAMDPVAILKDIGKQYGRRVSGANLFDANVCSPATSFATNSISTLKTTKLRSTPTAISSQ